ncbi:hypothetical protein [Bombilactobacillus mellis]|uniref:hypothetical protein n=1 Tax=Bombilactobacillus mellis TaxID=1218508 RepID=UPI0015811D03|nr:hypothetical protein [Bombilactobacillus mellis]MCT6840581.1 hypothetical protein [Bombilactobacillus mellis]MCT6873171.1 hypothetical protein [Bombilactobacillus mellis]MCX0279464.1 hypothetical protein [Bombilactobacillus mellis]NUF25878.1 hypothetical protein [Bombilactobacillus mellis]NUF98056.1 hypothetical protein [Bombilactobacillus mellis]
MKNKWHKTAIIITFIALIALFWAFYSLATGLHSSARSQALDVAHKQAAVTNATFYSEFDRQQRLYSVGGYDRRQPRRYKYVIINGKNGKIKTLFGKPNLPYQAQQIVINNQHPQKVTKVALGYHQKQPVWEVTFLNKDQTLGYYLLNFKNTKIVQVINHL